MPGNKSNVRRFNQIDVHIASLPPERDDLSSLIPASFRTALGPEFRRAGLISPEGFVKARDESNTVINAYGVDGIVESIDTFNFESWAVIFLEDNPVVQDLVYPGSVQKTGGELIRTPVYRQLMTAFTLENTATGYGERWFSVGGSIWRVNGDRSTPDSDIRRTPLIATMLELDPHDDPDAFLKEGGIYFKQKSSG